MFGARTFRKRRMAALAAVLSIVLLAAMLPSAALAGPAASTNVYSGWGCSTYHYVQPGQTLSGIARWYGVSVQAIAQANGIWNVNYIRSGTWLCIPYPGSYPGGGSTVHVVHYGETLSGIARWYGTTVQCLCNVNGLWNPNYIRAGQRLVIAWC